MRFSDKKIAQIRRALLGAKSGELIRFMQHRALGMSTEGFAPDPEATLRKLGWLGDDGRRTELGICAADSCREYQFWIERDRRLPFEGAAPQLEIERFRNRKVLEIGSGMGTNLMSFALQGAEVMGIEPVEAYVQIGAIFCEREGIDSPDVRQGVAEKLPFEDGTIDLILCVSAHQYFDLDRALTEFARVLRSGGEALIIGGTLGPYFMGTLANLPSNPRVFKGLTVTTLNTLSYSWLGCRILPARSSFSTARPIYPAQKAMMRMLQRAGLRDVTPPLRIGSETCFHVRWGR